MNPFWKKSPRSHELEALQKLEARIDRLVGKITTARQRLDSRHKTGKSINGYTRFTTLSQKLTNLKGPIATCVKMSKTGETQDDIARLEKQFLELQKEFEALLKEYEE